MTLKNVKCNTSKREGKKKIDYRKWANKHLKDPTKQLPMTYGTGYNAKKYVSPTVQKAKKTRLYNVDFICNCGHTETYRGGIQKTVNYILGKTIPSCLRCANFMKVKGIKENIFVVLYIYLQCLLKMLKKN